MKKRRLTFIVFLSIVPMLIVAFYSYKLIRESTLERLYEERRSLASLSARVLKEKLDRVNDLGLALANGPSFRQHVEAQKWDDAIAGVEQAINDFDYIEHLILTDISGTVMMDLPASPGERGRSYGHVDWFKELSKNWKPQLSEVYEHDKKIVTVFAHPVKNKAGKVIGALALRVNVSELLEWSESVSIGSSGFLYIVDQNGRIAASPEYRDSIVDYTSVPAVQKALKGEKNVEILYNPIAEETRLVAYEQIPGYGWSVIVQQEESKAFSSNNNLATIEAFYLFAILFTFAFTYFIIREMNLRAKAVIDSRDSLKQVEDYRYALDESSIVATTDQTGIIRFVNDNFCKISKYGREELLGQDHRIINSGYHPKEFIRNLWVTIANGIVWKGELKNKAKDGTIYWVDTTIVPFLNERGKPWQYVAIRNDITDRKDRETEIENLTKELESFSYSVSHDLRAPLRALEGYANALSEKYKGKFDENADRWLNYVSTNAKRMDLLTLDILNFSRLSKVNVRISGINMKQQAQECFESSKMNYPGITINFNLENIPYASGTTRWYGKFGRT